LNSKRDLSIFNDQEGRFLNPFRNQNQLGLRNWNLKMKRFEFDSTGSNQDLGILSIIEILELG
jgi:hypothetical protein